MSFMYSVSGYIFVQPCPHKCDLNCHHTVHILKCRCDWHRSGFTPFFLLQISLVWITVRILLCSQFSSTAHCPTSWDSHLVFHATASPRIEKRCLFIPRKPLSTEVLLLWSYWPRDIDVTALRGILFLNWFFSPCILTWADVFELGHHDF